VRLATNAAMILLVTGGAASAQSVSFAGSTFVNKGLVGVARVPSNATDEFGETLGGFGSGMAMDLGSWHKDWHGAFRGTYTCCRIAVGTPRERRIFALGCIVSM
jgi:hypothetical protein